MPRTTGRNRPRASSSIADPFRLRDPRQAAHDLDPLVHVIREGVRCDTEKRGYATPQGRSPFELVVDASQGFIPMWEEHTTLRWRFQERSFQSFEEPEAAKAEIEQLLAESILKWEDAAPIKFTKGSDAWDFEIVMRNADNCNIRGCVLASAFFPDAGQHELVLYPRMFGQERKEQIDTMIHELGHVFGLRHFFAQVSETAWPSVIFGTHQKFSIMNYGSASELTNEDKADLKKLYQIAWDGELTEINGTPIKFMKPFHASGEAAEKLVGPLQPVAWSLSRR